MADAAYQGATIARAFATPMQAVRTSREMQVVVKGEGVVTPKLSCSLLGPMVVMPGEVLVSAELPDRTGVLIAALACRRWDPGPCGS